MAEPSQLPATKPENILDRYANGETIFEIAKSLGLDHPDQVYRYLLNHAPEQWKQYKAARALRQLDEAEQAIDNAPDALSVTRAREKARIAQWQLERVLRQIYGQDVPIDAAARVQINIDMGYRSAANATYPQGNAQVIDSE